MLINRYLPSSTFYTFRTSGLFYRQRLIVCLESHQCSLKKIYSEVPNLPSHPRKVDSKVTQDDIICKPVGIFIVGANRLTRDEFEIVFSLMRQNNGHNMKIPQ